MLSVSGCRGVVGESLTPDVIARFAGAYGSWLRERAGGRVLVVVGRDGRAGGDMVRMAALAGLTASGCGVIDLDVAMTPTVAVMTDFYARSDKAPEGQTARVHAVGGMVITASHNPQQWNGLKCLLAEGGEFGSAACAPPATLAAQIIERFKGAGPAPVAWSEIGPVFHSESVPEHIRRLLEAMTDSGLCDDPAVIGEDLRVAVDCVNASGRTAAATLLEALGCDEALILNSAESGIFPHPPEPTHENLTLPGGLCEAVRESKADVGFAQDPDADRLALIDEQGRYVGEEYTLVLGAMALLEAETKRRRDGETKAPSQLTLVTNLSTSRMLDDVAAKCGARVIRTAVGEANVVEVMKREKALAGGEGNGGVIWPRVTYVRDSLSAMALTLWLMSPAGGGNGRKRPLSELVASLPSYAIEKRKVELPKREAAIPAIEKIAAAYKDQRVDRQDGAWVDFKSGPLAGKAWLHVRASNTEPIMRLIAEAPTSAEANKLLDEAAKVVAP
jgi:phosphomannomutase